MADFIPPCAPAPALDPGLAVVGTLPVPLLKNLLISLIHIKVNFTRMQYTANDFKKHFTTISEVLFKINSMASSLTYQSMGK